MIVRPNNSLFARGRVLFRTNIVFLRQTGKGEPKYQNTHSSIGGKWWKNFTMVKIGNWRMAITSFPKLDIRYTLYRGCRHRYSIRLPRGGNEKFRFTYDDKNGILDIHINDVYKRLKEGLGKNPGASNKTKRL